MTGCSVGASDGRDGVAWPCARLQRFVSAKESTHAATTRAPTFVPSTCSCPPEPGCGRIDVIPGDGPGLSEQAHHARGAGAAIATWIYCFLWFLVQDVAKVLTYQVLENITRDDRVQQQAGRGDTLAPLTLQDFWP